MKKIFKIAGAMCIGVLILLVDCNQANSKNYYDTKYNNIDTKKPYKKEICEKIAEIQAGYNEGFSSDCRKDFNGDGKKEKVKLSAKVSVEYQNAKVVMKINNKVVIDRKISGSLDNISLKTIKIQGKCLTVLLYGDEDYAGGGALIYLWKSNQKLKLLKSYKSKGYLDVYVANDRTLNKYVLYIEDKQQLYNRYGEKWPSNVLRKYKKYSNEEHTSVTKSTYHKFIYKNGGLKNIGKDNYYRVGINYD